MIANCIAAGRIVQVELEATDVGYGVAAPIFEQPLVGEGYPERGGRGTRCQAGDRRLRHVIQIGALRVQAAGQPRGNLDKHQRAHT